MLAEGAVVAEDDGKRDAHHIIDDVSDDEQAEKHVVSGFSEVNQHHDENQREGEGDVAKEAYLYSFALGLFER